MEYFSREGREPVLDRHAYKPSRARRGTADCLLSPGIRLQWGKTRYQVFIRYGSVRFWLGYVTNVQAALGLQAAFREWFAGRRITFTRANAMTRGQRRRVVLAFRDR